MSNQEYHVTSRTETTKLLWRIHDILPVLRTLDRFNYPSPVFGDTLRWQLHMQSELDCNYKLYINLQSLSKAEPAWYKIALRNWNEEDQIVRQTFGLLDTKIVSIGKLMTELKDDLLPDGTLTVFCEIMDMNSIIHFPVVKRNTVPGGKVCASSNCREELASDLGHLLSDKDYCDVILKSSDQQEFSAHRSILHSRSPVFAVMFRHNMAEKLSGVVEIRDIDGETLQGLLDYIYTNDVKVTSQEKVGMLLAAAHKYQLQGLQWQCVNHMVEYLTIDNVCDVILLADSYGMEDLFKIALEVLRKNVQVVVASKPWRELVLKNAKLATEILEMVVTNSNSDQ